MYSLHPSLNLHLPLQTVNYTLNFKFYSVDTLFCLLLKVRHVYQTEPHLFPHHINFLRVSSNTNLIPLSLIRDKFYTNFYMYPRSRTTRTRTKSKTGFKILFSYLLKILHTVRLNTEMSFFFFLLDVTKHKIVRNRQFSHLLF